jgi:hypothetical protein
MSARITVILYILVYFELGAVLIISPWTPYWNDNLFLAYLVQRTGSPQLLVTINSVWLRACVSALGVVNIIFGLIEAFRYRDLVRLIEQGKTKPPRSAEQPSAPPRTVTDDQATDTPLDLPDHRPEGV